MAGIARAPTVSVKTSRARALGSQPTTRPCARILTCVQGTWWCGGRVRLYGCVAVCYSLCSPPVSTASAGVSAILPVGTYKACGTATRPRRLTGCMFLSSCCCSPAGVNVVRNHTAARLSLPSHATAMESGWGHANLSMTARRARHRPAGAAGTS